MILENQRPSISQNLLGLWFVHQSNMQNVARNISQHCNQQHSSLYTLQSKIISLAGKFCTFTFKRSLKTYGDWPRGTRLIFSAPRTHVRMVLASEPDWQRLADSKFVDCLLPSHLGFEKPSADCIVEPGLAACLAEIEALYMVNKLLTVLKEGSDKIISNERCTEDLLTLWRIKPLFV